MALFSVAVDKKDLFLLESLKAFFGELGSIKKSGNSTLSYRIESSEQIMRLIIPFFDKYPVLGVKSLDFTDFKKVAGFMQNKEHLTDEGLTEIIKIVEGMNLDRVKPKSIEDKT